MENKFTQLRRDLIKQGFVPGPIDNSLYHIYQMKLEDLKKSSKFNYKYSHVSDKTKMKEPDLP